MLAELSYGSAERLRLMERKAPWTAAARYRFGFAACRELGEALKTGCLPLGTALHSE